MSAPVEVLPLVARAPLQLPEAVQEVAFVELQVRIAALPLVRLVGFGLSVTTGAGTGATVTDVVALLLPPAPVQDSVKLALAVKVSVGSLPLVPSVPLQPPEAVHDVAFVELQLSVEELPEAMLLGDALSDTVGAATAAFEPSPPPHAASVKDAATVRPTAAHRRESTCQQVLIKR